MTTLLRSLVTITCGLSQGLRLRSVLPGITSESPAAAVKSGNMTGLGASTRFAFEISANRASFKHRDAIRRRTLAPIPDPLGC
jgi:hypothetical protein